MKDDFARTSLIRHGGGDIVFPLPDAPGPATPENQRGEALYSRRFLRVLHEDRPVVVSPCDMLRRPL